ncbi:uncharacterized protein N7511_002830 [Penicillium nucicola]|uniref:uncharacterized protein n=1 Tax=Penicillium nucicola TaxID=1850975 RepID=UPI00254554AE|nr:uncharacterized protein N7511_002830 [Penicillium nucicola]KAJ5770779.1 hypothetical protein N7511_002830 [Penicillium nucicola]
MSVIRETVCGVNTQLDRRQQQILTQQLGAAALPDQSQEHIDQLQDVIHAISVTSKTQALLSPNRLADLLSGPALSRLQSNPSISGISAGNTSDYVWIVAAKAAVQASGLVMNILLDQTLELHDEAYYWGSMLGSVWYSSLYTIQTSPRNLFRWSKNTYMTQTQGTLSITDRWIQFYQVAQQSVWKLGGHSIRDHLLAPIRSSRAEMRQKRDLVLAMKDLHTSSLGLLMEGWHSFEADDSTASATYVDLGQQWRDEVYKTVALIEAVCDQIRLEPSMQALEEGVSTTLERETDGMQIQGQNERRILQPLHLIERLVHVLRQKLPQHTTSMSMFVHHHGRPSGIIRYWLPVSAAILSGSVSIRFLSNKKEDLIQGIMDIGATTIDFWGNWVVHPIRKLIGTIRHDEKSEIAIMSKNSLLADRASLERMVVDFVRDRPDLHEGVADTTAIVNSVKEGDLTPVLKAYERDLRSPLVGTVRGDLIRALLIQIQKTKVDVEIAISGIDALLKSQELVFGFVGLTPGILVSFAALRWLGSLLGSRKGMQKGKHRHQLKRGLRNVARILTSSAISANGTLPHKDSGQLICEAEALLQQMKAVSSSMKYQEFREDIHDLLNVQNGVDKQLRVIERMRWSYFQ